MGLGRGRTHYGLPLRASPRLPRGSMPVGTARRENLQAASGMNLHTSASNGIELIPYYVQVATTRA